MNVANLDLCKELYELSGWRDVEMLCYTTKMGVISYEQVLRGPFIGEQICPAYDLGYLLRKLPSVSHMTCWQDNKYDGPQFQMFFTTKQNAVRPELEERIHTKADTPEDAVCKLAIELIKQKVITP